MIGKDVKNMRQRRRVNPLLVEWIKGALLWVVLVALVAVSIDACARPGGALDHALGIDPPAAGRAK